MRPINRFGPDAQQDIGGKQRPEEHYFRGQKEPDPHFGVEKAGVRPGLDCIRYIHLLERELSMIGSAERNLPRGPERYTHREPDGLQPVWRSCRGAAGWVSATRWSSLPTD